MLALYIFGSTLIMQFLAYTLSYNKLIIINKEYSGTCMVGKLQCMFCSIGKCMNDITHYTHSV